MFLQLARAEESPQAVVKNTNSPGLSPGDPDSAGEPGLILIFTSPSGNS